MEHGGAEHPVLIGQTGPLNGQRWLIEREMVMGRESSCDIVIADRQVSRFHARLTPSGEGVLLEDLGSKNGTYRNGTRLEDPVLLLDGDLLQVSLVQHFVFLSSDATVPMEFTPPVTREPLKGRLSIDQNARRVWVGSREVIPPLSVPQFRLLQVLYEAQGNVIERQDLINEIWGEDEAVGVSEQAFDALVRRLRDRLAEMDAAQNFIVTVRGHGLRLENPHA